MDPVEFDIRFLAFLDGLKTKFPADLFEVDPGKRYMKVKHAISSLGKKPERCESVYAFVDKTTGDVLKAASYAAPAKHARGNIFKDDFGLDCCGRFSVAYLR